MTLEDFRPCPRYDGEPWTDARSTRAPPQTAVFTLLETIPILPVDSDPENPAYRNFTTTWEPPTNSGTRSSSSMPTCRGQPTTPIQNVADDRPVYASVSELAQLSGSTRPSATTR